uniref:Secreted protein n=1 Tax=Plectus sambesii TaxID=2011161 RepID=A0A914XN62_9BILA
MAKAATNACIALFAIFCFVFVQHLTEAKALVNYKIDWRKVDCTAYSEGQKPEKSCVVLLNNVTETNENCFEESAFDGVRVYCRIHCELTPLDGEITLEKSPQNNHKCIKHVSYNNELRDGDWYAWRSGECLKQDISFLVRCWPELAATAAA